MALVHGGQRIVTDGLVLCLDAGNIKSYNPVGVASTTTWTDLSGNGNNGSLGIGTQAPTYSSANGGSLVFDGVDDYVQSNTSSVSIGTQVTVTAWVRHNTLPTKTQRYLTLTGEVAVIRHYGASSAKQLHFYIKTSGTLKVNLQVNNALEVNTWYYVVGTWNGTIMRLYKNAVEIGTSTPGGILDGGNLGYGVSSNPETMDGNISQVSIYNRALTAQEVQQNFNATRSRYGI